MQPLRFVPALLLMASSLAGSAHAQVTQRVAFARGNDNTSVSGSITGRQYCDYLVGARAGQRLGVSMITRGNGYFNILPPGSDQALYNSSSDGNDASGIVLPANGDYRIRVYSMGAAMRSSRPVRFQLSIMVM